MPTTRRSSRSIARRCSAGLQRLTQGREAGLRPQHEPRSRPSSSVPSMARARRLERSQLTRLTHHNARSVAGSTCPGRRVRVPGGRRRPSPRLAAPPAGVRPGQEIPGRLPDPRRTSRGLARRVAQPVELSDVRRAGLRGGGDQPARLDRLRPEVHRPDQPGLDRPGLRRPDEGPGPRAEDVRIPGRLEGGGLRRLVRRLHGQLDRRAHRSIQGADQPCRRLRPDEQVRHDRGALVPRVGVRRSSLGEARALSRAVAQQLRRQLQDADAGDPRGARFPRSRRPGPGDVHLAPAPRACPAATSGSPTRGTGSPRPRTGSCGGTRSRAGWIAI